MTLSCLRRPVLPALLLAVAACGRPDAADAPDGPDTPAAEAPAPDPWAPSPEDRDAVVATVQTVFDALEAGDGALLRSVLAPDLVMRYVESRDGERVQGSATVEQLVTRIETSEVPLVERMWEPEVRVDGSLATLWAPYDFYAGSDLSHCGVDAATLLRDGDGWRIVGLSWTRRQPPECGLHPEGPPAG